MWISPVEGVVGTWANQLTILSISHSVCSISEYACYITNPVLCQVLQ